MREVFRALGVAWSVQLALGVVPSGASAQQLEPPRLMRGVDVPTEGLALEPGARLAVVLTLAVDREGRVVEAEVLEGVGPDVDAAALRAARALVFAPATRDGAPIPARVAFRFELTGPPPSPPPTAPPGDEIVDADDPARSPPETPAETDLDAAADGVAAGGGFSASATTRAPPRQPTARRLSRDEVVETAGTRGDVLRSVELLPGVGRDAAGLGPIIRGAAPEDSLVVLEGAPVPFLYHVGGLTSFFSSDLLDSVELVPGNFSVRYGRALGGVLEVRVRDPRDDAFHGALELDVLDASALAEGPVGDDAAVAAAARRSWVDFILRGVMSGDDTRVGAAPAYWDYQALATLRPTPRDRVRLMAYGSDDQLVLLFDEPQGDPATRGRVGTERGFHRGHVAWRHGFDGGAESEVDVVVGQLGISERAGAYLDYTLDGVELNGRAELRVPVASGLRLIAGLDTYALHARFVWTGPPPGANEGDPGGFDPLDPTLSLRARDWLVRPAAYVEAQVTAVDRLLVTAGVRGDWFGDIRRATVDPRISARWAATDDTTLKAGVGHFSQPPLLGRAVRGWGNPDLHPERAVHVTAGVEQRVGEALELSLEGYYRHLTDRIVATADGLAPFLENDGVGRIVGAEVGAELRLPRARATLAYTLSRSERRDREEGWRLFDFDQTHILTFSSAFDLGRDWYAGATFRLVSGNPYTPVTDAVYDADHDVYRPQFGAVNSERNPLHHRLDLRLERRFELGGDARLAVFLDLINAYNANVQEAVVTSFDYRTRGWVGGLPILPSLGVRGEL